MASSKLTDQSASVKKKMSSLLLIETPQALRKQVLQWRSEGLKVALVPTMGALHQGHIKLIKSAQKKVDKVVVSIFVNPEQFAAHEDFNRYPRRIGQDQALLEAAHADVLYKPDRTSMYLKGFATRVVPEGAAKGLESQTRPHFFAGVATVVTKLLLQSCVDMAFFGEKDYQQLAVVKQLVRDLDLPVKITGVPTVREKDGLAMSSRNAYLTPEERRKANGLYKALQAAAEAIHGGAALGAALDRGRQIMGLHDIQVDYFEARRSDTLEPVLVASTRPLRLLAAGFMGRTRLIDNLEVK